MSKHIDQSPVTLLVAARNEATAHEVAEAHHGLAPVKVALLTYETHRAYPDLPLHVDPSWSSNRNAEAIRTMIAVRCDPVVR